MDMTNTKLKYPQTLPATIPEKKMVKTSSCKPRMIFELGVSQMDGKPTESQVRVWTEFSIDPTKSQFHTVRVGAGSRDIHHSICSDSH